eukprot:1160614-Pelagomonas_calceolata.AAC.16
MRVEGKYWEAAIWPACTIHLLLKLVDVKARGEVVVPTRHHDGLACGILVRSLQILKQGAEH